MVFGDLKDFFWIFKNNLVVFVLVFSSVVIKGFYFFVVKLVIEVIYKIGLEFGSVNKVGIFCDD